MTRVPAKLQSRHWPGKTAAGLLPGFGLAFALSGLFAWLAPGGFAAGDGRVQFNMWLVGLIWPVVLSVVYLFRTSLRAWLWLGGANMLAFGALWMVRAGSSTGG